MPENNNQIKMLPLLPLRGLSVFPGMLLAFDVERPASIAALNMAMKKDQLIFMATQKDLRVDIPRADDIYSVGTVCRVRQQLRQPHGNLCRVMVEGLYRAEAAEIHTDPKVYTAEVTELPEKLERGGSARREALMRKCMELFDSYLRANPDMLHEQILNMLAEPQPGKVADYIAQNVRFSVEDKQKLLEELYPTRRLSLLNKLLTNELNVLAIEKELNEATQAQMNRAQREYYLREELKAIQAELGGESYVDDIEEYREKLMALNVSDETRKKLLKELDKLAKQPFGSAEASVLRSYLDICLELPWNKYTDETRDTAKARKILEDDHFGLEKVKERILEYLAVRQLTPEVKGGLICLVGPPGTGKTSIAMSVARATNRKLVRISLGGVHDEAEIRGHRKTYVGAMPGRIINGLTQAGSMNPLMVLDEIDKLASDYRGDPSAALLEALDGEQNGAFRDNFLEIPFDLSNIFFIATANTTDTIPRALLDRMEVIELGSYTDEEKLQIAKRHLIPKQRRKHGLRANQLRISDAAIRELIRSYTRESGVRVLERTIANACRKAAGGIAEEKFKSLSLREGRLEAVLGPAKYKPDDVSRMSEVGRVHGLAYTSVGGELLDVEIAVLDGSGKIELTGNLGDVMKESVRAAITYVRSKADALGIDADFHKNKDIHIHFPEGAVPKDGPSAGITVCMALISALTDSPAKGDVAMTGEISLHGKVMPIGGLREKTMAAFRNGIRTVIIPAANESDLAEIDQTVRAGLNFVPVDRIDAAIDVALLMKDREIISHSLAPVNNSEQQGVRQ